MDGKRTGIRPYRPTACVKVASPGNDAVAFAPAHHPVPRSPEAFKLAATGTLYNEAVSICGEMSRRRNRVSEVSHAARFNATRVEVAFAGTIS